VRLQLDRSIERVLIDREQIKRVIVNLVDNAVHAMEGVPERTLTISTSKVSPETIELSIADTGCGVSPEDKEKLFLPYFSTKQRGTGLGLAIVSHIVTEHRGRVFVRDNFPQGARFTVELNALAPFETASRSDESLAATLEV
jgi:signal transduction histidine kinase